MRHRSIATFVVLLSPALTGGCTQDFDRFSPTQSSTASGPSSGSSGSGGSGGAGGTTGSSSASSSSASSSSASSSASASSSSSASSSASSTASSTGSGTTEDCLNNIDDDGDGAVDCADSDCNGGFTCVADAPAAWNGPVVLYDGAPAGKPAACPAEHPLDGYEGNRNLIDTPALCAACACSDPSVTCSVQSLELDGAGCNQQKGFATQPAPGQCGSISPPPSVSSYTANAPNALSGACTPSGGTATLPPPNWGGAGLLCAGGGLGGGCGNKAACTAVSGAPFSAGMCVYRTGDVSCPSGFGTKHLYVNDVIDTRGCTGCSCGGGTATCSAKTTVFSDGACATSLADVPNDGSCVDAAGASSIKVQITKSGSCPADGGKAKGALQEGPSTTTVCCVP